MKNSTNKLSILSGRSLGLVQIFLALLLSSCNSIDGLLNFKGNPTSAKISEDNPFASVDFPLESCGDSLPKDESAYPIELYTVFVVDNNAFKDIQEKSCQQVSGAENIQSNLGEEFVTQVGTFISKDRAELFKEILDRDMDGVQISDPVTITGEFLPEAMQYISNANTPLNTPIAIAESALLDDKQLKQLLSIDGTEAFRGSSMKYRIKVVLPTYIPQGFELTKFNIHSAPSFGNAYFLWYKNPTNNSCFIFRGGFIRPIGGPPVLAAVVYANSPALGQVPIAAINSEKMSSKVSSVGFYRQSENRRDFGDFEFKSPGYGFEDDSCQAMNFVEAVKVAESFQFLQVK